MEDLEDIIPDRANNVVVISDDPTISDNSVKDRVLSDFIEHPDSYLFLKNRIKDDNSGYKSQHSDFSEPGAASRSAIGLCPICLQQIFEPFCWHMTHNHPQYQTLGYDNPEENC